MPRALKPSNCTIQEIRLGRWCLPLKFQCREECSYFHAPVQAHAYHNSSFVPPMALLPPSFHLTAVLLLETKRTTMATPCDAIFLGSTQNAVRNEICKFLSCLPERYWSTTAIYGTPPFVAPSHVQCRSMVLATAYQLFAAVVYNSTGGRAWGRLVYIICHYIKNGKLRHVTTIK